MQARNAVEFARAAVSLKRVKRAGWVQTGIQQSVESVAEHSHGVSLLAVLASSESESASLDTGKLVKLACVHDVAEAVVGDITPSDNISATDKHDREEKAMQYLCQSLPSDASSILSLWHEFEDKLSEEAILVSELDKVILIIRYLRLLISFLFPAFDHFHCKAELHESYDVNACAGGDGIAS